LAARGSILEIRVADNGCGITTKVASVMFEPLEGRFAEGTGMGLPIVKFIAERYRGSVTISSSPPSGYVTEIVVTLHNVVQ
jgi:signal transduction histidine kinase